MSAAPRTHISWLQTNYDKLILVALLVVLLASAAYLLRQVGWENQQMKAAAWERPFTLPKSVSVLDLTQYQAQREAFFNPYQVTIRSNALMVSELRVSCVQCGKPIVFVATTCPFCGATQPERKDPTKVDTDGDGLPDVLEVKYGLNPLDPNDAARDADSDGFSNIEEIQYGSDPFDAASYPPPVVKLRLLRAQRVPFKLRFQGMAMGSKDRVKYQVNLRSLERTFFVQIGDVVEGFKIIEYQPDAEAGPTLLLQQGDTVIPLVKGQAVTEQELVADLVSLLDRRRLQVRIGDAITIKDYTYNVIDIKREGVLLRDEKSGKETLVGMLTESERLLLSGGSGAVIPSAPPAAGSL